MNKENSETHSVNEGLPLQEACRNPLNKISNSDNYRPFEEARAFARSLNLKNKEQWRAWAKTDARPSDIPANPARTYAKKGWHGFGDWLGTGRIANQDKVFKPFDEARAFARFLNLDNQKEWAEWAKTDARPSDIPACPNEVYDKKGWIDWGDWLGTGKASNKDKIFRPFDEVRAFARSLNLDNQKEWAEWAKTDARPSDIPAAPNVVYEKEGWKSWGDFLGTENKSPNDYSFRPFEEARTFARSLGFNCKEDWTDWAKTDARPSDIPSAPNVIYDKKGWMAWGDWLGTVNVWNSVSILAFIKSLLPILDQLGPDELFSILKHNRLIDASKRVSNSNASLLREIIKLASTCNETDAVQKITNCILDNLKTDVEQLEEVKKQLPSHIETNPDSNNFHKEEKLPELRVQEILSSVDRKVQDLISNPDEHIIEFLISKAIANLWKQILSLPLEDQKKTVMTIRAFRGGAYSATVSDQFIRQYDGACALEIPQGYGFSKNGEIIPPNLMQQLVAFRIKNERALGNWSGVGAGKTLAAILASRVVNAKLTLVIALNNTLEGWRKEIEGSFPRCQVFLKKMPHQLYSPSSEPTYLILNYEAFQQKDSEDYVEWLVENHSIDFVVLDEIQNAKQRGVGVTKRRNVLEHLLLKARIINADLRTLGMSATPVINSLDEAVSLLSMIKGEGFKELKTFPNLENCISIHEKLVLNGVRHVPYYQMSVDTSFINIPGQFLLEKLLTVRKNGVLKLEQILLEAKLPAIHLHLKPGTIIYTHFVEGLVDEIKTYLEHKGFTYGEFTGNNKQGLQLFLERKIDILVASSTIGTGIDGLQYVCDQLIILCLPWTNSGYEQLLGRIHRQGSIFNKIKVIIPQVMLENGGNNWSWDKQRMDKIREKKTLGDAVLDGIIPEEKSISPGAMLEESRKALEQWIRRLEQGAVSNGFDL